MLAFLWLLWGLVRVILGGPVLHPTWPEEMIPAINGVPNPPFYRLPVFLHTSSPLIPQELFRPAEYRGPLPAGLTGLLIPPLGPHKNIPDKTSRAVEAWCGTENVSVRVDRWLLRAWSVPSLFRIGSCLPSTVTSRYLYFQYRMLECGGQVQVIGGQLVYSYLLNYTPPSEGYVIRASPINLPIHCYYNRFHYSYKVGFRPQVQHTFLKSMKSKLTFTLTVCNAQWEPLSPGHTFFLGEQVYFLAQAKTLLAGERLYVDSCQATSSEDASGLPKVDIITNYGCMTDSRREDSNSQFVSGGGSVVKFSVDAFLFSGVSQVQYLHCTVSVGLSTSNIAKSCNFKKAADRWEELTASPSVCSCCDSVCTDTDISVKNHVRSPGWRVEQNLEKPMGRLRSFKAEERENLDQKITSTDDVKDSQLFPEDRSGFKDEELGINLRQEVLLEKVEEQNEKEVKGMKDEDRELKTLLTYIMSDEARPHNNETGPLRELGSNLRNAVSGLSTDHKSSDASNYSSDTEYNHITRGSSDVATAVDGIIRLCPHSDGVSCRAVYSASQEGKAVYNGGNGTIYRAVGTEALSSVDVRNSSVTLSEKVTPELDLVLWSKQVKCVNKSATGTAYTPVGATDSISSEGFGGDVDLQGRESQTEQTHPHWLRNLICNKSDLISGSRGQVLAQTLLRGEGKFNKDSGNIADPSSFESIGS